MPAAAAATRPALGRLMVIMTSKAMTGRARRTKIFQIPDTRV
jgi:hypothetical protein